MGGRWQPLDQQLDPGVDLRVFDRVVVVEHEHERIFERREVVDQQWEDMVIDGRSGRVK